MYRNIIGVATTWVYGWNGRGLRNNWVVVVVESGRSKRRGGKLVVTRMHSCVISCHVYHSVQTKFDSGAQLHIASSKHPGKNFLNNSVITSATALQQLHWLPIKQRMYFKIATVTYRILQTGSPAYFSPFINLDTPSTTLRSASHNFLHVPFTSTAVSRKAFRYAAPTV